MLKINEIKNRRAQTKIIVIVSLFLFLFSVIVSSTQFFQDKASIDIQKTKTIFSIKEDGVWNIKATEYTQLYKNDKLINPYWIRIINKENYTERISYYFWNTKIIDIYEFDDKENNINLFPKSHKIQVINGENKELVYKVEGLENNILNREITSPYNLEDNMKLEWESGNYYSAIENGEVTIKYKITSDNFNKNIRLFDPLTEIAGGKAYVKSAVPSVDYPDTNDVELTDGIFGPQSDPTNPAWVAWDTNTVPDYVNVTVNLTNYYNVTHINASFMNNSDWGISAPIAVRFYTSNDSTGPWRFFNSTRPITNHTWYNVTGGVVCRYVRVEAYQINDWIFEDEIQVFGTPFTDTTPPVITIVNPAQATNLPSGTASTIINISTDETAECKYNTTNATFDYTTQGTIFTNTNATVHSFNFTSLTNTVYHLYYKCKDTSGIIDTSSKNHTIDVGQIYTNLARNRNYSHSILPSVDYPDDNQNLGPIHYNNTEMTDGQFANQFFFYNIDEQRWTAWNATGVNGVNITIQLIANYTLRYINASFATENRTGASIKNPSAVYAYSSLDNSTWDYLGELTYDNVHTYDLQGLDKNASWVRIVAVQQSDWLFADEMQVYGITFDTASPSWNNSVQNDTKINPGDPIYLYAYGKDDINLQTAWLSTNATGTWKNETGSGNIVDLIFNYGFENVTDVTGTAFVNLSDKNGFRPGPWGFESFDSPCSPTICLNNGTSSRDAWLMDNTVSHSGSYSMKINLTDIKNLSVIAIPSDYGVKLNVTPGHFYEQCVWVKMQGVNSQYGVAMFHQFFNVAYESLLVRYSDFINGTADWQRLCYIAQAPETSYWGDAVAIIRGPGIVWFDDFEYWDLGFAPLDMKNKINVWQQSNFTWRNDSIYLHFICK